MQKFKHPKAEAESLIADSAAVDGAFVEYLQRRYTGADTIKLYRHFLTQLARSFSHSGRDLSTLRREEVPRLIRRYWPGRVLPARAALYHWLRLTGRFATPPLDLPFRSWVDDYARFLETDRGLDAFSRRAHLRYASRYLAWQFGSRKIHWEQVRPVDIWDYVATLQRRSYKTKTLVNQLSILRQFLRFIHLRGGCAPVLVQAVPTMADRGRSAPNSVLSDDQRQRFLRAFNVRSPNGRRDYAMALCMVDLGLRRIEVVRLRTKDIDWTRQALVVPAAKASSGRILPLPPHVAAALRQYLKTRPETNHNLLFVGHAMLKGRPISPSAVTSAIAEAYRRCGFRQWAGTHLLRRSFATRLRARGADMKEIADLLGHRLLMTTDRYTVVGTSDLRALVRSWPL